LARSYTVNDLENPERNELGRVDRAQKARRVLTQSPGPSGHDGFRCDEKHDAAEKDDQHPRANTRTFQESGGLLIKEGRLVII
jgi:hypothetical protein